MRQMNSYWLLLLAAVAMFCDASPIVAQEPKASQQLTLDALDSLGKGADTKAAKSGSEFSLSLLDHASSKSEVSNLAESSQQLWTDNLRFTVDLAYRPSFSGRDGTIGGVGFAGIDLHKIFTDKEGDWGTLTLQTYLSRNDNGAEPQPDFEDNSDFELVNRITNFNYTRHGKGKTNFRIGHFEVPFGLEQIVNTNGTLRDYTHDLNFGLKSDWGVTFNGEANDVEYELGLSRGSGNVWRRRDDPFIVAGRIGSSREQPVVLGISVFHGDVLSFAPAGGTVERSRVGADFTFADEKLIWLAEVSAGFEDKDRAYTALLEVDWTDSDESLLVYNQTVLRGFGRVAGWDNELRNSLGVRWTPDQHWTASGQFSHFLDPLGSQSRGSVLEFQIRYRF